MFCCFLSFVADNAVFPLQDLLRRESSEFGAMVRDPFYVISAGARWVHVTVPFITSGSALITWLLAAVVMCCLCQWVARDKLKKVSVDADMSVLCPVELEGVSCHELFFPLQTSTQSKFFLHNHVVLVCVSAATDKSRTFQMCIIYC